jgi:hypothetical protein
MTNVGKSPATNVDIWADLCADVIAAKQSGERATRLFSENVPSFGVILFPGESHRRNWGEMEMTVADFKENIAAAISRAKKYGDDESEWVTAWPGIMVCASYKLSGSKKNRHTVILYEIRHENPEHPGWDGSEADANGGYLKLIQTLMSGQVT